MKKSARKRRRFGYWRIGVLLEREGMIMNHKKLYRLYTDENREATTGAQACQRVQNANANAGGVATQ